MEKANAARRILIEALMTQGVIPGPVGETLNRSVGVMAEKPDFRDHYIEVVLPLAVDISHIPSEVDGVRVSIIHADRNWVATS